MTKPYNALLLPSWVVPRACPWGRTVALTRFGPLCLSSGIAASRSSWKANPDYYGEAPKMERVVVVFMEEDASLGAAVRAGQVDVATRLPPTATRQAKATSFFCVRNGRFAWNPLFRASLRGRPRPTERNEYPAGNEDLAI